MATTIELIHDLLEQYGLDLSDPNLVDTPKRVSRVLDEFTGFGIDFDVEYDKLAKSVFPHKGDNMVIAVGIKAWALCVAGDTLVDIVGDRKPIRELVGLEPLVYSWDKNKFVVKRAKNIRKTGVNREVWRVIFDQGDLVATPEHLVLLTNGKFKQISELKPYDRVRALTRQFSPRYINVSGLGDEAQLVYESCYGKIPDGYLVHHIDFNHTSNNPENLTIMTLSEHARLHALSGKGALARRALQKLMDESEDYRRRIIEPATVASHSYEANEKRKSTLLSYYQTEAGLENRKQKSSFWTGRHFGKIKTYVRTEEQKRLLREYALHQPRIHGRFAKIANHVVLRVEPHGFEDVYNMEVEDTENFVANGVVIHNCPHHALPIKLNVSIAYLPHGYVIGVSKLARFAKLCARKLQLQEDYTRNLGMTLQKWLHTDDVAVLVKGRHACMEMRGAETEAEIITSEVLGAFRKEPSVRQEFLQLIHK